MRIIVLVLLLLGVAALLPGCHGLPSQTTVSGDDSISETSVTSAPDSNRIFPVQSGDKWGYIDETGVVIIQPTYGAAREFHEGLAAVEIGGKWGYITQAGAFRIQPQFASATEFSDGLAVVLPDPESPYKVIEASGNAVLELDYFWVDKFQEGEAIVSDGSRFGFVDRNGALVIPLSFEQVGRFEGGLARAKSGGKWGFINRAGTFVIGPQYEPFEGDESPVLDFAEGLAAVSIDGKWGYLDMQGELTIPAEFEMAGSFSEGLAPVVVNTGGPGSILLKMGFINTSGTLAVAPEFQLSPMISNALLTGFHNGLAAVQNAQGGMGYIDKRGHYVIAPIYDQAYSFYYGPIARVESRGETMYVNLSGEVVFPRE
jgi:hypothetical protein